MAAMLRRRAACFLTSLSDLLPSTGGTEHLRSSENNFAPDFFRHTEANLDYQDLIAHEFVHSWNGKIRTPEGLWTPDLNTPSRDDLLWVYEGQTEYWGIVLAARAGLRTRQETLDLLAVKAAAALCRTGRSWKSLADSSLDPVFDAGHGVAWPDWQGREAYYVEGVLLWLDVDTLPRRVRRRVGVGEPVAAASQAVEQAAVVVGVQALVEEGPPVHGRDARQGGAEVCERIGARRLASPVHAEEGAGEVVQAAAAGRALADQAEAHEGGLNLRASLGLLVTRGGAVRRVAWDSPAFRAGLGIGAKLTGVNGSPYSDGALLDALRSPARPLRLAFQQDGRDRQAVVAEAGPPRYPRLDALGATRSLDAIPAPGPRDRPGRPAT